MFSKPNAIIYLRRSGLVVAGKRIAPARLNFSADVVENLELLHPEKFIAGCQKFFAEHDLRSKRVLLVLDTSVVFTKIVELDKTGKPAAITEAFVAAMPLAAGKRACVTIRTAEQLELYATNAELYTAITQALDLAGITRLLAITPAAAYHLEQGKQQLGAAIEQFVADTKVRQQANFATILPS